jgi:hypothetical protein
MSSMLDTLRASLPANVDSFYDYVASTPTRINAKSLFSQLILQLALNPSANALFLPNSNDSFTKKLYELLPVWGQQKRLSAKLIYHCSSLLEKVASNASDLDVWTAVTELLIVFSRPSTPPAVSALKSSILDTPARPNSGNRMAESQVHELVDPYLRLELRGAVYTEVHGFGTRFDGQDISAYWESAANCGTRLSDQRRIEKKI